MALLSDEGGVTLAMSPTLYWEGLWAWVARLEMDGVERMEAELERLVKAFAFLSRPKEAKERRLAREMDPMMEPWKVLVLVVMVLSGSTSASASAVAG